MVLPNKSLEFLRDILAAPGWVKGDSPSKKAKFVYLAGKMLCDVLPEVDKSIKDDVPCQDFVLDAKMTEAATMAVRFFAEEDRVPKGKYLNILIEEFKVLED
jgi:hypothetical protein